MTTQTLIPPFRQQGSVAIADRPRMRIEIDSVLLSSSTYTVIQILIKAQSDAQILMVNVPQICTLPNQCFNISVV